MVTFKLVKRPFIQLFSIRGFIVGETVSKKQVTLAHAIMSRRSTDDYIAIFERLKILCPTLSPLQLYINLKKISNGYLLYIIRYVGGG